MIRLTSQLSFLVLMCASFAVAQSASPNAGIPQDAEASSPTCSEVPREDALPNLCAPPSSGAAEIPSGASQPITSIELLVPGGTPLRVALDERVRIDHPGEIVRGKVIETVYAFDQSVLPAGSVVSGRVTKVESISGKTRTFAYASSNFSPFHKYQVTFDTLTLPDGKQLAIQTTVSPGIAEIVHLVSKPEQEREKQKSTAARAAENARKEAENRVHDAVAQVKSPGRLHRLKQFVLAQLPYRRQYLEPGTRFDASLDAPLDFGKTTRTADQFAAIGSAPAPDSILRARLVAEINSATAQRGRPIAAVLTEPLYSPEHQLILPANSRLVGEVVHAKPARKLHRNGELRVIFERIETPEGIAQAMQGSLEGVQVDRAAGLQLDDEGGAHGTDSKKRYLSTGLAVVLAAAAAHPDAERGATDAAGDPGVRAGAGVSGFRYVGALLSFAARSAPVSMAFGAYGAAASIYSNFLSRGRDVVLVKDTPLEIGFGNPHPPANQTKPQSQ
jgi:hypothetical protein